MSRRSEIKRVPKTPNAIPRIIITVTALAVTVVVAVGFCYVGYPERVSFITNSTLSIMLTGLIALQCFIYKIQWNIMAEALAIERAKIAPRLRVDEVRVVGFEIGQSPAFIVTLVNDGATEARDVAVYVQADHGGTGASWRNEQMVSVPANGRRAYPIRWSPFLSREVIDAYNTEPRLKVFGYFEYQGVKQSFCYHYYPWIGRRPADVPTFVPCDFDVWTDVTITPESARIKLTTFAPDVIMRPTTKADE